MADEKMKAGDDPSDFTVDEVKEFLAGADDDEKARVLEVEASEDGKQRKSLADDGDADNEDAADEDADKGENGDLRNITSQDLNPLY